MEQIIELLYEISKNAPALLALITVVALIGAAVVFGSKSKRFAEIRKSIDELTESIDRSERLLDEIGESTQRLEEGTDDIEESAKRIKSGIIEAKKANASALDLIRRLQSADDNQTSPDGDS